MYFQECAVNYATNYYNRADVKEAIHAKSDIEWSMCSNLVNYSNADINTPMEDNYKFLIDGGYDLHITVFSGDDDTVCGL